MRQKEAWKLGTKVGSWVGGGGCLKEEMGEGAKSPRRARNVAADSPGPPGRLLARSLPRRGTKTLRGARLSSPPRARTPPSASLAGAHAALGNFATNFPPEFARAAQGTEEEMGTIARGDQRCPLSSSPPGRGGPLLAPPVPARAGGDPRCQGEKHTRFRRSLKGASLV